VTKSYIFESGRLEVAEQPYLMQSPAEKGEGFLH